MYALLTKNIENDLVKANTDFFDHLREYSCLNNLELPKGSGLQDTDISNIATDVILSTAYKESMPPKSLEKMKLGPPIGLKMMFGVNGVNTNHNPKLERLLKKQVLKAEENFEKELNTNKDDFLTLNQSTTSVANNSIVKTSRGQLSYKNTKIQLIGEINQLLDEHEVIKARLREPPKKASSLKQKPFSHSASVTDLRPKSRLINFVADMRTNQITSGDLASLMQSRKTRRQEARSELPLLSHINEFDKAKHKTTASGPPKSDRLSLQRFESLQDRPVPKLARLRGLSKMSDFKTDKRSKDSSLVNSPLTKASVKHLARAENKQGPTFSQFNHEIVSNM